MASERTSGAFWSVLFGGGLLALSAVGCSIKAEPMADAPGMPLAGSPSMTTDGVMAMGPGVSPGNAGMSVTAGAGGSSTGADVTPPGAAAGAPPGAQGGSGPSESGGEAGGDANTAGDTADPPDGGITGTSDAAMPPSMHEDLGKGDGRDVVLMGDSYMSNTLALTGTGGGLAPSLQRASGQPYRNYGVQGVMLLSFSAFGPAIPTQWDSAKRADPDIKTVVMTGGGNDVIQNPGLQSDCQMDGEQCKKFRMDLIAALDKLWTQMAADGVQDIIYVRYASQPGMMMPTSGTPMIPSICLSGKVRCHALDTTELVNGEIALDGIHPLRSANDRMAEALVDMMEAQGMRR